MPTAQDLRVDYQRLVEQMEALVKDSESEDRVFSDEEKAKWTELRDASDKLAEQIRVKEDYEQCRDLFPSDDEKEANDREYFNRRKEEVQDKPSEWRHLTAQDHRDAVSAWVKGERFASPKEIELIERCGYNIRSREITIGRRRDSELREAGLLAPIEERAQGVATGGAGGFTVADEMMAALSMTRLRYGGVRRACRVVMTDSGADYPWPIINDTGNSGVILGENTQDTEQDVTVTQLVLGAYKITSKIVRISMELMQDASFSWETTLAELLGARVGRGENAFMTTGTGTGQHNGIVTTATDSGVTAAAAAALTWVEVTNLQHSVDPDYRIGNQVGWMCNDSTYAVMRQISDSQNRPMWNADMSNLGPGTFSGFPIFINQSMANGTGTKALLFGDMSQYIVRDVRGVTIRRSDERYWDYNQSAFNAVVRSDSDMLQSSAIKYLTMG